MKKYPLILRKNGATVRIYKITQGDPNKGSYRQYYTYCWKGANGRERESATIEANALQRANEILNDLCAGRADRVKVTAEKLAFYRACEEKLGGSSLMAAVDLYLAHIAPPPLLPPGELVTKFLREKESQGVSGRHLSTLRHHLNHWLKITAGQWNMSQTYLDWIPCLRTRRNHRITLITFGKWAVTMGYVRESPFEKTTNPIVPASDPGILTPYDLRKVLAAADECTKKFIVFGAFAGLRASEILRVNWQNIDWPNDLIILGRDITKTKRRRTVHIQPNLSAWILSFCKEAKGPIVDCLNPHLGLRNAVKAAGVVWKHNALRHSSISYMMALTRNAAAVAEQHGNSEAQVQESYKANTTEAEAKDWFNILP